MLLARKMMAGGSKEFYATLVTPAPISGSFCQLLGAAFAFNMFIFVGADPAGSGGLIITSPDGLIWTRRTSGTTQALYDIAFNGTTLVAVGDGGVILTSTNGTSWTARSSGVATTLITVAWVNNCWLAGGVGGVIRRSTANGGTAWSSVTSGVSNQINKILAGSGTIAVACFAGGGTGGGGIITSANQTSWSSVQATGLVQVAKGVFANGLYLLSTGSGTTPTISRSTNLTNWTTAGDVSAGALGYGLGQFIAVHEDSFKSSKSGSTFKSIASDGSTGVRYGIAFGTDRLVIGNAGSTNQISLLRY